MNNLINEAYLKYPFISANFKLRTETASKNISYNGIKLNAKSNKGLDDVAGIMTSSKSLYLDVEVRNEQQGTLIRSYLAKKGVDVSKIRTITVADAKATKLSLSFF